jgi:predicted permease
MSNLRLALRSLRKTPGFTALAVLVLGLGLGVNATLFTLVRTLLLAPPSGVADPGRLVRITRMTDYGSRSGAWAYPDYAFYRDETRTFSGIAALGGGGVVLANTGRDAVEASIAFVSGNYFAVLGIPFAAGRPFGPSEDAAPGAAPVAVVSSRFWRSHLGADPSAIGSTITLNGHALAIVGVTADAFRGINAADGVPDVWTPIMMLPVLQPSEGRELFHRIPHETDNWIAAIGRLEPGVTIAAARADLTDLWQRLNASFPEWNRGVGVFVTPHFGFAPFVRDRIGATTRLLMAAALAVLLVACANLALLLLARATTQRKETGIRLALGASRARVMGRLLGESVLLAVGGGALGLLLATWSANLAAALLPVHLSASFRPDGMVLAFTTLLALATALVCGVAPAWTSSRTDVTEDLKGGAPGAGRSLMRNVLVVAQVTVSLALVAGAGLFVRSLLAAQRVDLGFVAEQRLLVTVSLEDRGYTAETGPVFIRRALERIETIPGVQSVSTTTMVAFGGGMWTSDFVPDGVARPENQPAVDAPTNAVGPGYFHTMGIPLTAGRDFTRGDDRTAMPVVIVNQTLARQVWGTESPLGRTITRDQYHFTVIGVARDAKYYELGEQPEAQLYFAELQYYRPRVTFLVHGSVDAAALTPDVRRAVHELDPTLAIAGVRTYGNVLNDAAGPYRVTASLVSLFGVLALLLASVGLYGVLSYVVVQRTREIAVRMALGAEAGQVAARVVRRGLGLTGLGIAAGLVIVWPASRLARQFLFGVRPGDPATLAAAAVVLIAVAAAASLIPARRAARIDPMEALRHE